MTVDLHHLALLILGLSTDKLYHGLIKLAQILVAQLVVIHQAPLTTCILIAPTVTFTREVNPFGMTELITHEVEVTAIDRRGSEQTYHLVQCDAAMGHIVLVTLLEMPVHIRINEAEDDGLVTHKCLVMTLGIGDGLLVLTTVGHLPEHAGWFPVLIGLFLDELDPIVGHIHRHAVIKSVTAMLDGSCQSRHTRHLLGNGDSILVHLMDEVIGQCEVTNGITILIEVVVVAIPTESLSQAMAAIEHRGDTIEAETVELVLLHPETAVGEQEAYHIILGIVKAERIPCRMLATVTGIEILVGITGKIAKPLKLILHGM